ncbi:11882_t:CDS:2, partial [Diversispora eburnea]
MTKIISILVIVGLIFSCLSLISQAKNPKAPHKTPPTSIGNLKFPNNLVIPSNISVNLDENKFAFSLCIIAGINLECNVTARAWTLIGPTGVTVNDCEDFKEVVCDPTFITAVTVLNPRAPIDNIISGGLRSAIKTDTSSAFFTVEATSLSPNPSVDGVWFRSFAFNQSGVGAFSDVTYLQRVKTKGGIFPPNNQSECLYLSVLHSDKLRNETEERKKLHKQQHKPQQTQKPQQLQHSQQQPQQGNKEGLEKISITTKWSFNPVLDLLSTSA